MNMESVNILVTLGKTARDTKVQKTKTSISRE